MQVIRWRIVTAGVGVVAWMVLLTAAQIGAVIHVQHLEISAKGEHHKRHLEHDAMSDKLDRIEGKIDNLAAPPPARPAPPVFGAAP